MENTDKNRDSGVSKNKTVKKTQPDHPRNWKFANEKNHESLNQDNQTIFSPRNKQEECDNKDQGHSFSVRFGDPIEA